MAFQQITDSEIQSGAPIDAGLLIKVKDNDSSFNATDISIQQQIADILNKTDDALVGETKYLMDTVAPRGFIPANGVSIGKTAGTYSGSDYFLLYQKLWSKSITTAGQPYIISATKGINALTDWNAGKTITIDESGLFTRAYKSGTSGNVGEKQADAFQDHKHYNATRINDSSLALSGYTTTSTGLRLINDAGTSAILPYTGAAQSGNIASETRPINVAKYVFIRYSNKVIL